NIQHTFEHPAHVRTSSTRSNIQHTFAHVRINAEHPAHVRTRSNIQHTFDFSRINAEHPAHVRTSSTRSNIQHTFELMQNIQHTFGFFNFSIIYNDSFHNKIIKQSLITYAIHISNKLQIFSSKMKICIYILIRNLLNEGILVNLFNEEKLVQNIDPRLVVRSFDIGSIILHQNLSAVRVLRRQVVLMDIYAFPFLTMSLLSLPVSHPVRLGVRGMRCHSTRTLTVFFESSKPSFGMNASMDVY
ncbi:hypothetical protein L9F63_014139, partial [Diploptera punctata]